MTAVVVQRAPFGERTTFAQAECRLIGKDTVAVLCSDERFTTVFGPMEIFRPGQWLYANGVDDRGMVLYAWLSELGKAAS